MELGADAVVLVLDPDGRSQARDDLGRVLGRRCEHESDGVAQPQARLLETPFFGEDRRLADVAGEHAGPLHRRLRSFEGPGDGRLQQPLAQPDPQLSGEDLDHVLGSQRVAARQQLGEDGALGRGAGSGLDRGESLRHFGYPRGVARVRLIGPVRQEVGNGHAQVRRSIVGLAQGPGRRACQVRHGGSDRGPSQTEGPLVGLRERSARQEDGRRPELGARKLSQVPGQ